MPPLSRESLSDLAEETRVGYAKTFERTTNLMPRLDELWERMEKLADRESISIERVGGIMTLEAVSWSKKGTATVIAAGQTGIELFDEKILDSYRRTLSQASEKGVDVYIRDHMRPFLQMAKAHFDSSRETWTEKMLGGNVIDSDEEE
jgi:hypothetical protein